MVLAQGDLVSNPDYATIAAYNLDTGATIYAPCTGNGGPAPGDALESDVSGNENGLTTRVIAAPQPSS